MATRTVQVSGEVYARLAELAAEHGVTLGRLIQQLTETVEAEPTQAQTAERLKADREIARQNIGIDITDEEFDQAPDIRGNIYKAASEKVRAARAPAA